MNEGKNFSVVAGSNDDQYTGIGNIWELAKRNNEKEKIVRIRKVSKTAKLPLA